MRETLSLKDALFLIVGNVIGIGIFTTTGYAAGFVQSPLLMLLLWMAGGLLAFCGAVTYAELAARYPQSGGDYHYLSQAFHPMLGYIFGWSAFVVTYTGSIAVIAVGFSQYFSNLLPANFPAVLQVGSFQLSLSKIVAISIVFVLTAINTQGLQMGKFWQNLLTLLGISVLLFFIISGFSSDNGNFSNLLHNNSGWGWHQLFSAGGALAAIFFTFSGWTAIVYLAGEVRLPRRNIPKALSLGILIIVLLYLLVNIVYMLAMPLSEMKDVVDIGHRSLVVLRGEKWSVFFTIMILFAVLSTLNATILSGSRIYHAMAKNGEFFRFAAFLHPKHKSPNAALWLQAGWTVLLILSGTFNQLLAFTVAVMLLFALLAGVALFRLRYKYPDNPPVYRAFGFPVTTILFVFTIGWILLTTVSRYPAEALKGIGIVLLGIPLKYVMGWQKKIPVNVNREKTGLKNEKD